MSSSAMEIDSQPAKAAATSATNEEDGYILPW
jgi:hypothetical protein